MTSGPSTPFLVRLGSGIGLAIGGLAFFATLLDYGTDPTRRASVPGYWSNLYDIQARALMDGHLDVPTGSLGIEGIVHDGQTHMYFPLFPALLRLPVLLITHEYDGKLTLLSMAIAWIVFAAMTTRLFWLVCRITSPDREPTWGHAALGAVFIAAATGGTTLTYDASQPWVYNEAYVWAVAAAVGASYWMVRVLTDGESMSVRWLAGFVLLCVLTRPTEGWAIGFTTLAIAAWIASGRVKAADRRLWWRVALAGLLPLALGVAISEFKFDTVYLHPLSEQVWTSINAHRREALAVNGGSLTGVQFFMTSLIAYFRLDGIRFVDYFPWITLPAHPVQAHGDAFIDQSYRTGSVTAFMPLLLVLTVVAAIALIRPGARREDRVLLPPLVAGVLITGGVMGYGYYAMRYVSDFVPALVFGAGVGFALLLRWLDGRRRLTIATLWLTAAATLFAIVAHMTTGHATAVVSTSGPQLRSYVEKQVALSGGGLAARVTRSSETPTHGTSANTDDLMIVGDCDALYLNTGDAYRPWAAVAARTLTFAVSPKAGTVRAGSTPVFETSSGWTGTVQTRIDGRARVVLYPPLGDDDLNVLRGTWQQLAQGMRIRVENDTALEFYRISTDTGGQVGGIPATTHDREFDYSPVSVSAEPDPEVRAARLGLAVFADETAAPRVCRDVAALNQG